MGIYVSGSVLVVTLFYRGLIKIITTYHSRKEACNPSDPLGNSFAITELHFLTCCVHTELTVLVTKGRMRKLVRRGWWEMKEEEGKFGDK